jgi:Uma2 family endonuclease
MAWKDRWRENDILEERCHMTIAAKSVTAEDLLDMAGHKYRELFEGELRTVSPANARHGDIALQIGTLLKQYIKPRNLGKVLVEGGYILRRQPDTVLGPDVSFIKQSRIPEGGLPEKFYEGPPDLAIEIISPRNPRAELLEKMKAYLKGGTPLGWLVDPVKKSVEVYEPGKRVRTTRAEDTISAGEVIPGFSCGVAEFFE